MNAKERVFTSLSHKEPDKVPLFLFTGLRGAKTLGLSFKEYLSDAKYVFEGQKLSVTKYHSDCLTNFFYGPIDCEAWGGEVVYSNDGPPNSGRPVIKNFEQILDMKVPIVANTECLNKVLTLTRKLKEEYKDEYLLIGVIISPFSLPVMQMGFGSYLDLIYEQREIWDILMQKNIEFSSEWANAQVDAGADVVVYFDPLTSPSMIPRELYLETGYKVLQEMKKKVKAPLVLHLASSPGLGVAGEIAAEFPAVGVSSAEDLSIWKERIGKSVTMIGNLDGISMRTWTPETAEIKVREAIAKAGQCGGFILSDNHGEIPSFVSDEVLQAIYEAREKWGTYPLKWLEDNA